VISYTFTARLLIQATSEWISFKRAWATKAMHVSMFMSDNEKGRERERDCAQESERGGARESERRTGREGERERERERKRQ